MFSFSGILRKMEVAEVQTIDIENVGEHAHTVDVLANMWSSTDSAVMHDVMPDVVKTCKTPRRGVFLSWFHPEIMLTIVLNVHSGGNPAP
ncbi:hypothetical protein Aduo_009141 [Ancylostoma duodenale]